MTYLFAIGCRLMSLKMWVKLSKFESDSSIHQKHSAGICWRWVKNTGVICIDVIIHGVSQKRTPFCFL